MRHLTYVSALITEFCLPHTVFKLNNHESRQLFTTTHYYGCTLSLMFTFTAIWPQQQESRNAKEKCNWEIATAK